MNNNKQNNLYWSFWFLATISTGILAGFLTSHSIMLGRLFSWLLENDANSFFKDYFSVFRQQTQANVYYNLFLWIGLAAGIGFAVVSFLKKRTRIVAMTAGLSTLWVSFAFFLSDFNNYETAVSTGVANTADIQHFLVWNLPLHTSFACFYTLAFVTLLVAGFILRGKAANKVNE